MQDRVNRHLLKFNALDDDCKAIIEDLTNDLLSEYRAKNKTHLQLVIADVDQNSPDKENGVLLILPLSS